MKVEALQFQHRTFKKNDCLFLEKLPEMESMVDDIHIDKNMYKYLKRLPIIFYAGEIKKEPDGDVLFVKIKKRKLKSSKVYKEWMPVSLFKIVQTPKMQDVISWFFNGVYPSVEDYTNNFDFFKAEMETLSRYCIELFQYKPKALQYLNKELNHLYATNTVQDVFLLYKTVINNFGIQSYELYNKFIARSSKQRFIDVAMSLDSDMCTKDAIALFDLNDRAVLDIPYMSSSDRLKRYSNPKEFVLDAKSKSFASEVDELKKLNRRIKDNAIANDSRFLKEVNQDIIDELELTIFDTSILEETDQLLYIFIDKDNNKRFYLEDFFYEFYVSEYRNVIDNDYIVPLAEQHMKYSTSKIKDLKSIIFAINDNHKNFMVKGSFK